MFTLNKFWEKFFYTLTYVSQGSSYLNPKAYAIMHRMHHAFSDTEKDPHSPHFFEDVFQMMWNTRGMYVGFERGTMQPEREFAGNYPIWDKMDKFATSYFSRLAFGAGYIAFYVAFATQWWMFLLLPIHFIMGPLHGAIVNWCGHKYGYSSFDNNDKSRNTTPFGFMMLGELFQNNHHKFPNSANFAQKWYEIDPVYPILKTLHFFRIIKLRKA
jgi:stearoyl-CoA desaturase (delta-9 desaturase)